MLSNKLKYTILHDSHHVVESLDYADLLGLLSDLKTLKEYNIFTLLYVASTVDYADLERDLINYEACETMIIEIGTN